MLPHLRGLHLERLLIEDRGLILIVVATRRTAQCPLCSRRARRVHSRYVRTVADLPWGEHAVTLRLQGRRFFCRHRRCPRMIFAERLAKVVAPHARRTPAQQAHLLELACALGGPAGARLAHRQGAPIRRATLLRLLQRAPLPPAGTPRVLGVDDWSQRRGHTYGTILVDADQRRPIDRLPDRTATTLATWLEAHSGIEIVTRDRSGAYGEAVGRGAPSAVQGADRFHLVEDVGKALEQGPEHQRSVLRELALPVPVKVVPLTQHSSAAASPATWSIAPHLTRLQHLQQGRRARRLERSEPLRALHERGWPVPAIARHLGMGERTL
jgi:transposase